MSKISKYLFFLFLSKISIFLSECTSGVNHCSICNPITDLCYKCDKDNFSPNENGGCNYIKKCIYGNNYCIECSKEDSNMCEKCEEGYYPDEYGGCSYTKNCIISERGKCLKCKEDYVLVGIENYFKEGIKMCKSIFSEDLKFCEVINQNSGLCDKCIEGYYINKKDKKCSTTENCDESIYGICISCQYDFYLDKKDNICKKKEGNFVHCRESLNGEYCDICDDQYYFDQNKICIYINFCLKKGEGIKCEKCVENYYLTEIDYSCTKDQNCKFGDRNTGICTACKDDFYLDYNDGRCKSNKEDNDFKHCKIKDKVCIECNYDYFIGEDFKCSTSKFCSESYNDTCVECIDNYYLGLDNRCTNIKYCIYSDKNNKCLECENHYYFDKNENLCKIAEGNLTNCKIVNYGYCGRCKDNYYLNQTDHLCYSNQEKGPFYKCAITDVYAEYCMTCIKDYYAGYIDNICSKVFGCEISENEERCLQCSEYYCLNVKTGKCEDNDIINDETIKYYYRCNRTNEEGDSCETCIQGFELNKNGLCINESFCQEKEDDNCIRCKNDYELYCLNKYFGCIETRIENCLECNDILKIEECTKCYDGYEMDRFGDCIEIKNTENYKK